MTATNIKNWWGAVLLLLIMTAFVSPASAEETSEIEYIDRPGRAQNMISAPIQLTLGSGALAWKTIRRGNEARHNGAGAYVFGEMLVKTGEFLDNDIYVGLYANGFYGRDKRNTHNRYRSEFTDLYAGGMFRIRDKAEGVSDLSFYSLTLWAGLGYHKDQGRTHDGPAYNGRHESFSAQIKARLELFFPFFGLGSWQERTIWPGGTGSSPVPLGFLSKIDLRAEVKWDLSVHRESDPDTRQRNKWFVLEPRVNLWRFGVVPGSIKNKWMHWLDVIAIAHMQGEVAYGFVNPETRPEHWTYRFGGGVGLEYNLFMPDVKDVTVLTIWADVIVTNGMNGREDHRVQGSIGLSLSF